jgi:hypothetical protein
MIRGRDVSGLTKECCVGTVVGLAQCYQRHWLISWALLIMKRKRMMRRRMGDEDEFDLDSFDESDDE